MHQKWPKHLLIAQNVKQMPEKAFLLWNIEKPKGRLSIYLTIGIMLLIGILLFPIWPLQVKIIIWYISFYFLVFFVSLPGVTRIDWPIGSKTAGVVVLISFRNRLLDLSKHERRFTGYHCVVYAFVFF